MAALLAGCGGDRGPPQSTKYVRDVEAACLHAFFAPAARSGGLYTAVLAERRQDIPALRALKGPSRQRAEVLRAVDYMTQELPLLRTAAADERSTKAAGTLGHEYTPAFLRAERRVSAQLRSVRVTTCTRWSHLLSAEPAPRHIRAPPASSRFRLIGRPIAIRQIDIADPGTPRARRYPDYVVYFRVNRRLPHVRGVLGFVGNNDGALTSPDGPIFPLAGATCFFTPADYVFDAQTGRPNPRAGAVLLFRLYVKGYGRPLGRHVRLEAGSQGNAVRYARRLGCRGRRLA
jgi:hypothetical protein